MPNRAVISVAGSCMSAESSLMCCGGNPELSISCPFILTLTLVVEDQVKTHSEANLKYMDLEKKSKTSYAKWFPSVEKEAKEWGELRQRLGSGQSSVVSYFLNITAFCKDNNETALEVEQDILNSFRKNGFELISPRFNHMRNFLTCLPFMAGKGLFKQLKEAGVVQRAESFNVANLMPLVADNPLTPAGLLAPTYRNQLAFIDIFFRGMNNTNYNMAVCGTSGAGKTGLIQPLIRSVLDSGGFAVVFDMGDGYKSLCENMGGVYVANSVWTVTAVSGDSVTLSDGQQTRVIHPGQERAEQHIDLAYAITAHGAQGASETFAIALEGTEGNRKLMAGFESAYVALSRMKQHVQVYTDNRQGWTDAINNAVQKGTAHDVLEPKSKFSPLPAFP